MHNPPFRRRRLVVDRPFQRSLCLHGIGLGVMVLVAVSLGIFVPLLWTLGERMPGKPTDLDSAVVMIYMHERFWATAGICLVLVTLGALRLSHRIAGPLVRYKRNLKLLAEGKLPPSLRTRRHDYLKEEVACLNAAVDGVRDRIEAIRAAHAAVRREVLAIVERQPRASAAQFEPLVAAQRELERCLSRFEETGELDAVRAVELPRGVVLAFAGQPPQGD